MSLRDGGMKRDALQHQEKPYLYLSQDTHLSAVFFYTLKKGSAVSDNHIVFLDQTIFSSTQTTVIRISVSV